MTHRGDVARRLGTLRRALVVVAVGGLVAGLSACGDDDDDAGSGGEEDTASASSTAELLGPEDQATGEPVRIGMVSDGATQAFDNSDELRAAEAAAEYWNAHKGGVGGRPVEVVTCETGADPAGATDCANRFVEQDVVAVALSQSAVAESVWEPLHAAGVPTFWLQGTGDAIASDDQSSFLVFSPGLALFGLPLSVAESADADRIAYVVIDVPQAVDGVEGGVDAATEAAGVEYEVVAIPPGTADMTAQMQQVASSGAGVVEVIGNDAFCIAAFNGLNAVGYEGEITTVSQCITDSTREGVSGDVLEGIYISSAMALGATDDPTFQLYEAVIETYGQDVQDVANATSMGGYMAMASLLTALQDVSGDITAQTVLETIRSMPESELPGAGGVTYTCGGSVDPERPAVCTDEGLRSRLDAEGRATTYEVVDTTDLRPE